MKVSYQFLGLLKSKMYLEKRKLLMIELDQKILSPNCSKLKCGQTECKFVLRPHFDRSNDENSRVSRMNDRTVTQKQVSYV